MDSRDLKIRTAPGFWIALALMVLILPLPWVCAVVISSLFHELCHLAAAKLSGARVWELRLGAGGAYLHTAPLSAGQSLVCALAGPVGALVLLLFARWMPRTALCALVQSCYHLLPLHPLDGGRALAGLAALLHIPGGETVCRAVEATVLILLGLWGLYLTFAVKVGLLPLLVAFGMIFRVRREKFLANRAVTGYNRCTI